jgi:hypothetical protein
LASAFSSVLYDASDLFACQRSWPILQSIIFRSLVEALMVLAGSNRGNDVVIVGPN